MCDHCHHAHGHSHPHAHGSGEGPEQERRAGGVTRRRLLGCVGAAAAASLAGCLGGDSGGSQPDPVTLTTDDQCEVCGMVIPNHPGPSAEVFYRDEQPSGHDNPARFDSTWEAFQYDFERRDRGWDRTAFYVTDYSSVDYSLTRDGDSTVISTHPEADAFADATGVTFVVGSEVKGAMGRDLIGFSAETDAESFSDDHGGTLLTFGDVTRETVAGLGMG
jgi:copper chaperone NosL